MSTALSLGVTRSRTVMASTATVTVVGTDPFPLADRALDRLESLEHLWSRFRAASDISRLNRAEGRPVEVSPETVVLLAHMRRAHLATGGSFDPTRLRLQIDAGDSTSLDGSTLAALPETDAGAATEPWYELASPTAVVPRRGIVFDAGGIGKGLAADLVAREIAGQGTEAVCVNVGGDLRICARDGSRIDWPVVIAAPKGTRIEAETVSLRTGAVATSDLAARSRPDGSVPVHIVDDRGPVCTGAVGATVIAGTAAWAEAWTKHLLSVDHETALADIDRAGLAARVVLAGGRTIASPRWNEFCP